MNKIMKVTAAMAAVATLSGCVNPNETAKKIGAAPQSAVDLRGLESRRYDTLDFEAMLSSATQTLQDLGYTITESSSEAGVLVGSKQRDAEESGQVAGAIAVTVLLALMGAHANPTWDKSQDIHVTVVAMPILDSKQVEMRVSFDRYLTNNLGQQWRAELIQQPEIYQEFFDKLSQSAFLEAHQI
jgi:hypothetical protein